MKITILILCSLLLARTSFAEHRFGRPVLKVQDAKAYQFTKSDGVEYPSLSDQRFTVSCLVYRGADFYYVEVNVTNKTSSPVHLSQDFVSFEKPGYTLIRYDTMMAAREAASAAGLQFTPTAPPYVPPTYRTTISANSTTYGNQTEISGTETTTADYSGQAGANLGNAIGNAIAAHRFYKFQKSEVSFSRFLEAHDQTDADTDLQPGQSRDIVATFDQSTPKKKPFTITIRVASETFKFAYKE